MPTPLPVLMFDDRQAELSPLDDLRASFEIRTGARTTLERWSLATGGIRGAIAGARLGPLLIQRLGESICNPYLDPSEEVLLVNGRAVLPTPALLGLAKGQWAQEEGTGHLVAARITAEAASRFLGEGDLPKTSPPIIVESNTLLARPWHVRRHRDAAILHDLATFESGPFQSPGVTVIPGHGAFVGDGAKVSPGAILDLEGGPIVLDRHAVVRPGAIIIGPAYIGQNSTVLERATIRPMTAIGPWCKVNGEIGGTILQGYSNKAHDGYLGDSWLGEWVNLGAGTTNSNLLNTYGEVIAKSTPGGRNERTGEQFLGAIIGDHVKTAICSRIMTGTVIHTGGMFASTAPISGCTPRFAWVTDAGVKTYREEKFLEVAAAAMARRKMPLNQATAALIQELFREIQKS